MKSKILLLTLLTTLSFSDDAISVPLEEAVQVNSKLIQVLFEENKSLKNEIEQIKEKMNTPSMANTSFVKNAPYNERTLSQIYNQADKNSLNNSILGPKAKILLRSANVRNTANIRSGEVIAEKEKGAIVQCDSFENNWCKLNTGGYIWGDYLKDAEPFKIITNKKAILRVSPQIKAGNVSDEIGSGIVLNAVSYNKGWYKLENDLYISDVTTSRYCK